MNEVLFGAAPPSSILVLDPWACEQLLAKRREMGGDRYDEVWEGTYVMNPLANPEHQWLAKRLTSILDEVVEAPGLGIVYPGVNVTDRVDDWRKNYRCPDVVVVLKESRARVSGAALVGGPDFLIEVQSPGDRSLDKLEFYSRIGVRELLVVGRDTKELELFALREGALVSTGQSVGANPRLLASQVVPLSFQLIPGPEPRIAVNRTDGVSKSWTI